MCYCLAFIFSYSMLSVTDELLTYINVRSYHYILLIIDVDAAKVEIMDSLAKEEKEYKSIIDALKKIWPKFTKRVVGDFKEELTFQHIPVSSTS